MYWLKWDKENVFHSLMTPRLIMKKTCTPRSCNRKTLHEKFLFRPVLIKKNLSKPRRIKLKPLAICVRNLLRLINVGARNPFARVKFITRIQIVTITSVNYVARHKQCRTIGLIYTANKRVWKKHERVAPAWKCVSRVSRIKSRAALLADHLRIYSTHAIDFVFFFLILKLI